MRERAIEALKEVLDPDVGVNIVDLGLLETLEIESNGVIVELIMTSPACPQGDYIADESAHALEALFGDVPVSVRIIQTPFWTPERMTDAARRQLGWP